MSIEYVGKCPGCEMPLTEYQMGGEYCPTCRRPLRETIKGFIPRRCNQCGAVIPTDSVKCRNCGGNPGGPAIEGYSEAVNRFLPPDYARRLRDGEWGGAMPAGWYVSESYMSDDLADFIIETAIRVIFSGTNSSGIYEAFGVGISLRISSEDRKAARDLVRRLFRVH